MKQGTAREGMPIALHNADKSRYGTILEVYQFQGKETATVKFDDTKWNEAHLTIKLAYVGNYKFK